MYQNDAEILFPARAIGSLRRLRGPTWQALVERVVGRPENDPDVLAFGLMMIRLDGCLTCQSDSYRAMRGCTSCARQTINRFKGPDDALVELWEIAHADVLCWIYTGQPPRVEPLT